MCSLSRPRLPPEAGGEGTRGKLGSQPPGLTARGTAGSRREGFLQVRFFILVHVHMYKCMKKGLQYCIEHVLPTQLLYIKSSVHV